MEPREPGQEQLPRGLSYLPPFCILLIQRFLASASQCICIGPSVGGRDRRTAHFTRKPNPQLTPRFPPEPVGLYPTLVQLPFLAISVLNWVILHALGYLALTSLMYGQES